MKISFIIPTRNQAPFIRRCIDSCLAHGFQDFEVIVIDGASTDGTQKILSEYGHHIQWISEPDKGQSDAVNKGVSRASGEIIAWINSDDYYPGNGLLKKVLALFEEYPMLDIVYGDGIMVDIKGNFMRRFQSFEISSAKTILSHAGIFVCQPALFFRRQLFVEAGGLATHLNWAMDLDLWLRMFPMARRVFYTRSMLACATYHLQAKSVYGMLPHIREIRSVLQSHRSQFMLSASERFKLWQGEAGLFLYWLAVKLRLKRAV